MGRPVKRTVNDQYYSGQVVDIYNNPRDEDPLTVLAVGELVKKMAEPDQQDCFMRDGDEKYNITRCLEKWKVKVLYVTALGESWNYKPGEKKDVMLPFIYNVGRVVSGVKTLRHAAGQISYDLDPGLVDNFEGVPGWGQQF
jgi:hypothetical protein